MSNRLGRGLDSLLGILDRDDEVASILETKEEIKPVEKMEEIVKKLSFKISTKKSNSKLVIFILMNID